MTTQEMTYEETIENPIQYGFSRTFGNAKFWITTTILWLLIITILSAINGITTFSIIDIDDNAVINELDPYNVDLQFSTPMIIASIVIGLLTFLLQIVMSAGMYRNALREIDYEHNKDEKPKLSLLFHNIPWKRYIISILGVTVTALLSVIVLFSLAGALSYVSPLISVFIFFMTMILFALAIPFFTMIPIFALDNENVDEFSFSKSIKSVKNNYFNILGIIILISFIIIGICIAAGIIMGICMMISPSFGTIIGFLLLCVMSSILIPFSYLATAKLYRNSTESYDDYSSYPQAEPLKPVDEEML